MKKASVVLLVLIALFALVSCQQEPEVPQVVEKTPTIRGSVSIPDGSDLSGSDFYIRVMEGEKAVYTGRVNADGSFSVSGLSEEASYSILVTTEEPGDIKGSEKDISRATKTSGYGGWLSNVTASINEQAGVGSIKVKPLGTIKGVVKKDGAEDNYDTTVYIPGTSYLSMTDGEGNFSLFNVPQATYTLRYISNGYMAKMVENVILYSESDTENPVTTVQRQTLIKNAGNLMGTVTKKGAEEHSDITVMLSDGKNTYTGSTAKDGTLLMTGIEPGTYTATISSGGFLTQTKENIKIDAAKNTTLNPISLTANGGTITGSVTMNDGGDKAGVIVTAMTSDRRYSYTAGTDVDGKFSLTDVYPGEYTLTLSQTGYAIRTKTGVKVLAGQSTSAGLFVFSSDYGTVSGTVKDSKGNVIENAIVKVGEISIFTGANGQFSKTGIPVGNHTVSISKEGYNTQTLGQTITVESSKTVNIGTIRLSAIYGSISGTVSVNDGKSAANIDVTATDSNGAKTQVKTLSNGTYTIANLLPGTYTLTAESDGYSIATRSVAVTADGETTADELALTSLYGSIEVAVSYSDSDKTSGITVTLYNSEDQKLYETTTTDSLNVKFNGIPVGTDYRVVAEATGYGARAKAEINVASASTTLVTIPGLSNNCGMVNGRVTDTNGDALENAIVKIGDVSVFTGSDGRFSKSNIEVGNYTVTVSKDGYTSKTLSDRITIESSRETAIGTVLLASEYGKLTGSVTVNDGGTTSGINISAISSNGNYSYSTLTDENGNYVITGVQPGTYTITAKQNGYTDATTNVDVIADRTATALTIGLSATTGSLKVTVGYTDKTATAGITVTVNDSTGAKVTEAVTTDSHTVSFTGIPVGTYTVTAEAENYAASVKAGVSVMSALETSVSMSALTNRYGTVSGKVTDTDGAAIENAIVKVGEISVLTGEDGRFSKTGIPVGNHTVSISKDGYETKTLTDRITVEASSTTDIGTVLLSSVYGKLTGSVRVDDGKSLNGIGITAVSSNGNYSYSTLTDENGNYVITSVQPGTYTVTAKQSGYTDATASVDVIADRTAVAGTINLASVYGSVSGKVALADSADNSGVTVTLTFIADPTIAPVAVSGTDGTYAFSNLANAGQYSVTFSKDGYVSSTGTVVTVALGQNRTIDDVTLRSLSSKVSGTATLAETQDYTGISILLKATDNSVQYDATTDQQGSYVMARVKPGEYTLTVSKAGYVSKTVSDIIVESSTEKTLDAVSLLVGSRSITGSITAELKTDYSGFLVTATNLADEQKVYSAITNTSGAYTLAEMVPGEYQIVVSHTGYRTLTLPTVNVVEGTTKTIETYNVEINRGTIYGKATLEGRTSSAGVKVELLQGTVVYDTQYTDEIGDYSFYVPQGNYSGVRFSLEDFRSESNQDVMALFADNYVRVPDVELLATHNTVRGVVDVFKGLEDVENSNVTLSFDNNTQITPVVTEEDGAFVFRHVPVSDSKYYLRIARENCSDIVLQITVQAADEINLGVISMYSNTGTIKGQVVLNGEYDSSGILVSVETGTEDLTTYTDVTGRYELGGIPAGQVFTVTYSKTGWDTATVQIDPVLEALEVRDMDSITMTDSIAPVLESIVINSGANTTVSKSVTIQIDASDNGGSGITLMQYSWTDNFSMSEWKNYDSYKTMEIPTEDNGRKTLMLRVRDKFGNMSEIKTDTIELVDQYKVYHGTLSEDDLNWTKEKSPIVITGDITIPNGSLLVIEPGVDVLFDGNYSIIIEGYIQAIGTETDHIVFNNTQGYVAQLLENDGYYDSWGGINCGEMTLTVTRERNHIELVSGSILSHVDIKNMQNGITGTVMIEKCTIESLNYALNEYYGSVIDSEITGSIVYKTSFNEKGFQYVFGNEFKSLPNQISIFQYYCSEGKTKFFNNLIKDYRVYITGYDIANCTFDTCHEISINTLADIGSTTVTNCEFINCRGEIYCPEANNSRIVLCNFINNSSDYIIKTMSLSGYLNQKAADALNDVLDLNYNYWGNVYSNEIKEKIKSGIKNFSFIYDYFDDSLYRKTTLEKYMDEPWDYAGYKGCDFIAFEASSSQKGYKNGDDIEINLSMLSEGEITYYRMNQTIAGLLNSEWIQYEGGVCVFNGSEVDNNLLSFGQVLDIYVQCRTESGEMPIRTVAIQYASSNAFYCSLIPDSVFKNDSPFEVTFYYLNYLHKRVEVYIDGKPIEARGGVNWAGIVCIPEYEVNPVSLVNGIHEIELETNDQWGNQGSTIIPFYIDRPVPTSNEISILNENSIVPENGTLQLNMSITNAKHLKTLNIKSGDTVLFTKEYDDYKVDSLNESLSVDCSALDAGEHYVTIELLDYTGNKTTAATDFFTVE